MWILTISDPESIIISCFQHLDMRDACWDHSSIATQSSVRAVLLQLLSSVSAESGQASSGQRAIRRAVAEAVGSLGVKALPKGILRLLLLLLVKGLSDGLGAHWG